ncbi:MAG: nitroreductase family protein, partial [Candidatus Bathyarchaeia archaeon]
MGMPDFWNVIRGRRSIRVYLPKIISEEVLLGVVDAARWAPSAHNAQPWRFIIITDLNVKRGLAEAMASDWMRDLERDGVPSEV